MIRALIFPIVNFIPAIHCLRSFQLLLGGLSVLIWLHFEIKFQIILGLWSGSHLLNLIIDMLLYEPQLDEFLAQLTLNIQLVELL